MCVCGGGGPSQLINSLVSEMRGAGTSMGGGEGLCHNLVHSLVRGGGGGGGGGGTEEGVDNLFHQTERSPELTATEYTDTHRLRALVPTLIQCLCMFEHRVSSSSYEKARKAI